MKKRIGIVGYGYVGKSFYEFFSYKNCYELCAYDNDYEKIHKAREEKIHIKHMDTLNVDIKDIDLIVLCVNTPSKEDGSANINNVESVLATIQEEKLVLIKSIIPPKSTENLSKKYPHLRLVFSPEYIGESAYFLPVPYDFSAEVIKTPYFIFGGNNENTKEVVEYFSLIAGPVKRYIQTDSLSAEICKYMENAYFATKIIFCNEFAAICEHFKADYAKVRELWIEDNRIESFHTLIYNQDKPYCFGGKCLPKDLSAIIMSAKQNGYEPKFLQNVCVANTRLKQEALKPHILMIHRVLYDSNQAILPLYFDRKMVIGYERLKDIIMAYLKRGFEFGSLRQCLENPHQYFCLSFDDGFKEHLWVAKQLQKDFNIKKKALIFSINVGNTLLHSYSGTDMLYALAKDKLQEMFAFFIEFGLIDKAQIPNSTESNLLQCLQILKQCYIKANPSMLQAFYAHFASFVNLSKIFLNKEGLIELSHIATIASHSMTHRDLRYHAQDSANEIKESKAYLENVIQQEITLFCYPEGKNDEITQGSCQESGYTHALSVLHSKDNDFCIGRRNIRDYENA